MGTRTSKNSSIKAFITTRETKIDGSSGRPRTTIFNELWIPPPYNLCVNLSNSKLNVFTRIDSLDNVNMDKFVIITKAFADMCLQRMEHEHFIIAQVNKILT